MKLIDMTGHRYGRWLVKGRATCDSARPKWRCVCDCGNKADVNGANLRSGASQSCGCLNRDIVKAAKTKHGKAGSRTYSIWENMHARCYNPNNPSYAQYGARGIKVCMRWHKFENFYADMGDPPIGMSIERRNNDGDYKPSNCRWATRAEQSRNTSRNVTGTYKGKRWCLTDLALAHGINKNTALSRIKRGISFAAACTTPVGEL